MKRTARILTCIFTVVSLFGSVVSTQAATVKSGKKVNYYKTASTKKKAGSFKKATKLTAQSMSKGFVKFKKGKKAYFIKVADVKITGKFAAKVAKKTKVYNNKFKATKTTLKKGKKLTISKVSIKKKVAYFMYASKKYVKAADVTVSSFKAPKPAPKPSEDNGGVSGETTVAPTTAPTVEVTVAPTINPELLGDNIVPADKASFDAWDATSFNPESYEDFSSSDNKNETDIMAAGYGVIAPDGNNNKTYNLKAGTGAGYGHWNFMSSYGTGLQRGVTYQISFDYYCPFDNDFRLLRLENGEYAKDANGNDVLDANGNKVKKNFIPVDVNEDGTLQDGKDLHAGPEWQTFSVTAPFAGSMFLLSFGMWNGDTTEGVYIDNVSIRPVLATMPTVAPSDEPTTEPTEAPAPSGDAITAFDALQNTTYKVRLGAENAKFTPDDMTQYPTANKGEYLEIADDAYNHSVFNLNSGLFGTAFEPGKSYKITMLVKGEAGTTFNVGAKGYKTAGETNEDEVAFDYDKDGTLATGDWQLIELTGTIPATANEAMITYMGTWYFGWTYYVAGIAVQEVA